MTAKQVKQDDRKGRELMESFYASREFLQGRDEYHTSAANWYRYDYANYGVMRIAEHERLAREARKLDSEYLSLIATAYQKGFSFHETKKIKKEGGNNG